MIGMSQIKKKFYTGLAAGVGVGIVGIIGISIYSAVTIKGYKNGTNKNYLEKYTQEVYVTNRSILQGQTITSDMFTTTRVHKNMVPENAISSVSDNTVAKYSIGAGMTVTDDMLANELYDNDLRETELNTVIMPTNLVEGVYVDLRIQFPNGTDYVVIPELQVKQILNETIWFDLTEEQRALVNSAIVDTYLNEGAKLYVIEYVDQSQIDYFNENNAEIVKGELTSLIKSELPELYSGDYTTIINSEVGKLEAENAGNTDQSNDDNTGEQDWLEDTDSIDYLEVAKDNKAEIIYDFIVKYRNLVATSTSTLQTYQPTAVVIQTMRNNPNITQVAKDKLNEQIRQNIEALNNQTRPNQPAEDRLEDDYDKIVEGAQESIDKQKDQRNELMAVDTE